MKVPDGARLWVSVRRVCEALGILPHGQAEKLRAKPWATTQTICAVAEDGKIREMVMIDLDALPMWLATIEPSRVAERVREKLVMYQREAAAVLRDHFLGARRAAPYADHHLAELTSIVTKLAGEVAELRHRAAAGHAFVSGSVSPAVGSGIKRRLHLMGQRLAACKAAKNVASGRQKQTVHLRAVVGWPGKWTGLPVAKEAEALRELDSMERAVDTIVAALNAGRQLSLAVDNTRRLG